MYQVQLKEFYDKQNDILRDVVEGKRPKKRKNAALAYFQEKFYLIGWKLSNTACKSVWIFDSKSSTWNQIEDETFPLLEHHSVCVDEKEILLFGGQFRNSSNVDHIKLSTFNGFSSPNYKQHSSVSFNSCVYVFGGWNETLGISNNVTKFDPSSITSCIVKCASKVAPSSRYGHSAVVYSSCMLIIGGMDNNLTCCSDIWMFNFLSSCWEEIKPASIRLAIYSHCAVLSNAHIIVTGGKLADDSINEDCWIFSLRNRTWTNLGCLMTSSGFKFQVTNMVMNSSQSRKPAVNKSSEQLLSSAINYGYIHQDPLSFWTKLKTCSLTTAAKSTTIDGRKNENGVDFALKTFNRSKVFSGKSLDIMNPEDKSSSKPKAGVDIFVFGTVEHSEYYSVYMLNLFCKFL